MSELNNEIIEGKIARPLVAFTIPVIMAMFLQSLYGAVDLMIVGQFAESADVSAIATGADRCLWSKNPGIHFYEQTYAHIIIYDRTCNSGIFFCTIDSMYGVFCHCLQEQKAARRLHWKLKKSSICSSPER